jgi:hypothetical protein
LMVSQPSSQSFTTSETGTSSLASSLLDTSPVKSRNGSRITSLQHAEKDLS